MSPAEFADWRKQHGFTQDEAGKQLGVSKRSIFSYETTGPVPKTVALACRAVSSQEKKPNYTQLIKEQYPAIKGFFIVIPIIAEKENAYADVIQMVLNREVREWLRLNDINCRMELKIIITPSKKRMQVPIMVFEDETHAAVFKLRWY